MDFAGLDKYDPVLSTLGENFASGTNWSPEVAGEIGSYDQQMPGTSSNPEIFSTLEERYGSGSWDNSGDQGWSAFRLGGVGGVSQARINNSFSASYTTNGGPLSQIQDWCTSS